MHSPTQIVRQTPARAQIARAHRPAQLQAERIVVRPKLKLGNGHDPAEQQADQLADRVVASLARGTHPAAPARGPKARGPHASKATAAPVASQIVAPFAENDGALLPQVLEDSVLDLMQGGEPLPDSVRRRMEPHFGANFGNVRLHYGAAANSAAEQLGARAFTLGEHIVFNAGEYSPDSSGGQRLLAHELTHVAQQYAAVAQAEPAVHRDTEEEEGFIAGLFNSVGDFIADQGWRLVRRFSPRLEPILRQGPINWLREQLAGALDGVVGALARLNPATALDTLGTVFSGLIARAQPILAALASGDCQPLLQAIGQLKTFITDVATAAWGKLTEFLQPVGDFFTNLWNGYGAPAVQWLSDFGGELWTGLQRLGRDIWDWTEPVRSRIGAAWTWLKHLLFGDEEDTEGGTSEGIVGWITRKAGEAWDWVKEQTRPVWQPVADAATKIAELIPPPFIANMAEQMQNMAGQLNDTAGAMERDGAGRSVTENRAALANAVPSIQQIIAGVRGIIVGAGSWLLEKLSALGDGVSGLMGRLRASSLLSLLATALGWLETAAQRAVSWARDQVVALFDWLVQGFDKLTPFFTMVLETVQKVITVMGDLLQLPQLVLGRIWNLIPECIREPIKNFFVSQILGRIPVFGQFFTDPELWPRVQQTALEILRQIFVDGDIPRAAWTFFQAMLRVLGLPPELVVQVLAKAAQAIGDVLRDPIGFLGNLLRAMRAGFGRFFDNIGTHLLNGIAGWLFGAVGELGIRPPADFSLRSILGFVLEVLGITVDNIFRRLATRVGQETVDRLRRMLDVATGVWSFVTILVNEGPAGLWREIENRISNLWDQVVEGVIGWVTERIISAATRWLLSLLDATGIMPIINTLIAIYNAIESFIQYLRELLEIVSRVLDGIIGIARGEIDQAAGFLENALATSLPVAIGFLANQFGFGRISQRIQEILAGIRARVDSAIDWLIDRAIRLGQALLDMARRGVSAVRGAAARLREWWRERINISGADGQTHHLYFRGEGANAQVIIESEPKTFPQFIDGIVVTSANRAQVEQARTIYASLRRLQAESPPGSTPDRSADIVALANQLAQACAALMGPAGDDSSEAPHYDALTQGFATEVEVTRLTHRHAPGNEPSVEGGRWDVLNRRRNANGSYYIRGHLLNHNIGGPGSNWANLTPLTRSANTTMSSSFEEEVKRAVDTRNQSVYFKVTAHYEGQPVQAGLVAQLRSPDNPNADDRVIGDIIDAERTAVPTRISGEARLIPNGAAPGSPQSRSAAPFATLNVTNRLDTDLADYSLSEAAKTPVYLSDAPTDQLRQLPGVTPELATRIAARAATSPFRTRQQFLTAAEAPPSLWDGFVNSTRYIVRLYRRS